MRTITCGKCWAQVNPADEFVHLDWHARLERAIKGIPEPPSIERPL